MSINQIKISEELHQNNLSSLLQESTDIPKIHIIIPVFNESKSILDIIKRINNTMKNNYEFRITVIDDGSNDDTNSILSHSGLDINIIKNRVNQGKGKTIKKGFNLTKPNEIIVMIDGDGEHPPEEIPKLINPIINGEADFVIGSRFLKYSSKLYPRGSYLKNYKPFSHLRKIGNKLISILIYIFHQKLITDSQCGFRAFAPGFAQLFNPIYSRFELETEMTIFYIRKRVRIREVPVDTGLSTRESHMNIIRDSIKILLIILDMISKKRSKIIQILLVRL